MQALAISDLMETSRVGKVPDKHRGTYFLPVFRTRIQIYRIHKVLGLLESDLLVRGTDLDLDPNPSISKQKYKETLKSTVL